jgi:RNA polymerase sigma-70 factor (ECF subfamily)
MLAVRDGDLDCLGELFERHNGALFGFLYKLIGNRMAAEDVAQTVFQRILKYRRTYRDTGSFTAWMYHLARRCAADHFRKAQSVPLGIDPADLSAHADSGPQASEHAAASDDQAMLQAALLQLDAEDRTVLLLSRIQELSFAEVAEVLECSVGAARVRAHRAMQALREHFFQLQPRPSP